MKAHVLLCALLVLRALPGWASPPVTCTLEQNGEEAVMTLRSEPDALGGRWQEIGAFSVRALLAAPQRRTPWLLIEVYHQTEEGDRRILTAQKVRRPFETGNMEVVAPRLGHTLRYQCGRRP